MAIELLKEPPAGVSTPDGAHESFFVNEDGEPSLKNSDGSVRATVSLVGDPLVLNEQPSAPSAVIDAGHIYSKDINGITELFYRDDSNNTGKETQITLDGTLAANCGTFFGGANIGSFVVSVPSGATGDVPINTGVILPLLGNNQVTTVHMRIHGIGDTVHDVGELIFMFAWAAVPTLPDTGFLANLTESYGHSSFIATDGPDIFTSLFSNLTLNTAGEIILHFDDTSESNTYEAQVHLSVGGFITVRDPTLP